MAIEFTEQSVFYAEKVNLYVQGVLKNHGLLGVAENIQYRAYRQAQIDNLVEQLVTWCVAGRVPSNMVVEAVEWPDGVWQMFKSRYMPEWFIRKFPVKRIRREFKTVTNHYFVCPHLVTGSKEEHIMFMTTAQKSAGRSW